MVGSHLKRQNIPPLLSRQSLKYFATTLWNPSYKHFPPTLWDENEVVVQEKFYVVMGFVVVLGEHGKLVDKLLDIYNCS